MQHVIAIHEKWSPESIFNNIGKLRSEIKWKNFKLTYDAKTFEDKGYFVVHFSYGEPARKSSIIIYREKVEITSKDWRDILLTMVLACYVLREGKRSIFLESILEDLTRKGEVNRQFQELILGTFVLQYLDLVEGKVPNELVHAVKETVRVMLEHMLQTINDVG